MSLTAYLNERRTLLLDGAMATLTRRRGIDCDNLCLTAPHIVRLTHLAYIRAGANIITTNTFNTTITPACRAAEICRAAVTLSRKAVTDSGRPCFVAGGMGPSIAGPSTGAIYRTLAGELIRGGADLLLLETIYDLDGAQCAIEGIRQAFDDCGKRLPLMLSATLDASGKLPSGHTLSDFVSAMCHSGAFSLGLNCGFGFSHLTPWILQLSKLYRGRISFHPSAGLPDTAGRYADTPEQMGAKLSRMLADCRPAIIGGCCGTTPQHIYAMARVLHGRQCNA